MAYIKLLKECADYAPILAFWSHRQWYTKRNIDFDIVVESYKKRICGITLPMAWVAIEDTIPVGMVSLKENDLWKRQDLNPWLSSLFVLPEYRNFGIAALLMEAVINKAKKLAFEKIYLFASSSDILDIEGYYTRRKWKVIDDCAVDNDGNPASIFCYML